VFAAVAGKHDVTVLQSNASVLSRPQIGVTAIAGEPDERTRQIQAIAFCDPAGAAHVSACTLVLAGSSGFACEFLQSVDALGGDAHSPRFPLEQE
jgi:hypothetical protein